MKLKSPIEVPERILLYGQPGTGKSRAALTVANAIGDHKMYVVDTDYSASYDRLMYTEFPGVENVEVRVVDSDEWPDIIEAVTWAAKSAGPGDWVVVDSMSPTWGALQRHFITLRHGDNFLDVFAMSGKDTTRQTVDADMNWQAINAEYNKLYKALFLSKGHLLLTAEADAVDAKKDDAKVRGLFEGIGFKPKGQKTLAHTTHTVLLVGKSRTGYHLTTVKDRGRSEVSQADLNDFSRDYLMKVAKWRPDTSSGNTTNGKDSSSE